MKSIKSILSGFVIGVMVSLPYFISLFIPSKPFSDSSWKIVPIPDSSAEIIRTPVPHGWLIAYKSGSKGLVYIPDNKHEWKINYKTKNTKEINRSE